jgi:hypothetical protein
MAARLAQTAEQDARLEAERRCSSARSPAIYARLFSLLG